MNRTKMKQTNKYTEQTSGYQWAEGSGKDRREIGLRIVNYYI